MRAMIFAAGLGTRLLPFTAGKPKALVNVAGKTLLECAIDYLKNYGITEIVVNVHHFGDQIIAFLRDNGNFGLNIHVSDERDFLLDTGGGLKKAEPFFPGNEPVVLYNVDIFSTVDLRELVSFHLKERALATLVVRERETSRYLLFDSDRQLSGWKDIRSGARKICRPDLIDEAESYAFSGIHVVSPGIFRLITETGRFSIIDLYLRLARNHIIKAYIDESKYWFDLGKADQLPDAEKIIGNCLNDEN